MKEQPSMYSFNYVNNVRRAAAWRVMDHPSRHNRRTYACDEYPDYVIFTSNIAATKIPDKWRAYRVSESGGWYPVYTSKHNKIKAQTKSECVKLLENYLDNLQEPQGVTMKTAVKTADLEKVKSEYVVTHRMKDSKLGSKVSGPMATEKSGLSYAEAETYAESQARKYPGRIFYVLKSCSEFTVSGVERTRHS